MGRTSSAFTTSAKWCKSRASRIASSIRNCGLRTSRRDIYRQDASGTFLRYNSLRNRNAKASHRNSSKRGPLHGAPHDFSSFVASLSFRFTAAFAGTDAASEQRPADPFARRPENNGLLHDGGIVVRGGCREDSAHRDGFVADGGESAAANR